MRNVNCRNVRREIEEAGSGDGLSAAVSAHLASCANCETLSREQSKLHALISNLGTVEAPGDFDFRLRARLAGESRGQARPFSLGDFSFGLRAAAVAMVLAMVGLAFVFVSFQSRQQNPAVAGKTVESTPVSPSTGASGEGVNGTKASAPEIAVSPTDGQLETVATGSQAGARGPKRRSERDELAGSRDGSRVGTREMGSTPAGVVKRYDQLAGTYPTAAFPINASYQSLKVSVDDGRGSSRTISLPTVSFGSQRALSQGSSPLVASARGVW